MKRLTLIIGLLILISCSNRTSQNGQRELLPDHEKYIHSGFSEKQDSIKLGFKPDTTIGQISLISSRNVDKYLGEDIMDRLSEDGLPNSNVLSSDKKQHLTFYFHPGGVKKEFSEFKVEYSNKEVLDNKVVTDKEFVTESKVKLGMTIDGLRAIKGEPDSVTNKETKILHYRITDFKNSQFLQKYNMPVYYADYEFMNEYLIKFKFGFEYP
jgi:hypothetical protein